MTRATGAFWRGGFAATSLDTLSEATGMNRPSLYAAFGDKRALYLSALQRYADAGLATMRDALDPQRPLREGLRRVYETALKMYFPSHDTPRGCFLIGTAATEAVSDDAIRDVLQRALRSFDAAFEARFRAAAAAGELPPEADPAMLARLASALLHTLALRSRAGDARATLLATASAGIALLCGVPAG